MSDARWLDVEGDIGAAVRHFSQAASLYDLGGFSAPGLEGYRAQMAFMHAMQSGHTSLEAALLRILEMLGEERPVGERWHADLIRRVAMARPGARPAVLDGTLAVQADLTRRFRNVATRAYDGFEPGAAGQAVQAGRLLAAGIGPAIAAFRTAIERG